MYLVFSITMKNFTSTYSESYHMHFVNLEYLVKNIPSRYNYKIRCV